MITVERRNIKVINQINRPRVRRVKIKALEMVKKIILIMIAGNRKYQNLP